MKVNDIRKAYDLFRLAESYGVRLSGRASRWGVCPLPMHAHYHNTPSLSIFWAYTPEPHQRFKCHGNCGASGDVIDFCGYMEIPGYDRGDFEDKKRAVQILTSGKYRPSTPKPPPRPNLPDDIWRQFLPVAENARQYLYARGLLDEQIEMFRIGSAAYIDENGRPVKNGVDTLISLPTFHFGGLVGVKLRKITGTGRYRYFSIPGSRKGLFGFDQVYLSSGPVLLVKGEIAATVLSRFGFLACAPTAGEGSSIADIQSALAVARVVVVGDNDADPEVDRKMKAHAEKRALLFQGDLRFPPGKWHDIDQWLLNDTSRAQRAIESWLG